MFLEELKNHFIELLCTSITGIFLFSLKYIWKRIKNDIDTIIEDQKNSLQQLKVRCEEEAEEQDKLREGVLAVLHDKLYILCREYISNNEITIEDLSNLEYLYKGYKGLGGNGTGEELYTRCKALPIKDQTHSEEV